VEHLERLREFIDPTGMDVAEVGSGNGDFAEALARAGAKVTGIEISPEKVARARARHGALAFFVEGRGEALPLEDASCDLITFNFSLHHIPADVQHQTMSEVQRCLRAGGRLHVEPDLSGAVTEIIAFVDDERRVRAQTAKLLAALPDALPFRHLVSRRYILTRGFSDFGHLLKTFVQTDPQRAERLPAVREAMQKQFERRARRFEKLYLLEQPCTAWHFVLRQ
jgi:SAM-dependent methyltransferase